ncbi:membrane protein [Arthrobacter phage KeAlii]|uniref:Membrane protein n=1 Tax=Arthrobacter phage KeAlii TaxID=2885973 RepID=A0AA94WVW5_9CAUD|nr:membrane protein [Arthrobacter phage KeAlii]UDL14637.1 membrane protein [Arthrobacter phage KeAlii]
MKPETADGLVALLCLTALVLWCFVGPDLLGVKDNIAAASVVAVFGSLVILKAGDATLVHMKKARLKK